MIFLTADAFIHHNSNFCTTLQNRLLKVVVNHQMAPHYTIIRIGSLGSASQSPWQFGLRKLIPDCRI